jgi:multicomponent K+:H+ antiporter subunit G
MSGTVGIWVEMLVAVLLAGSGLLVLTGALGLLRLKDFFQRMHPPALGATFGTWCASAASIAYFSAVESTPVIHAWLIPILLSITVPITTILLARAALFRRRAAGDPTMPAPLAGPPGGSGGAGSVSAKGMGAEGNAGEHAGVGASAPQAPD